MHRYRTILATLGDNFLTNLVAYYAFENNANDSVGGKNGTLIGSPTFVSGKNGNAINFGNDATLRYINIADNNDFTFTNGTNDLPFSISMWVNFSSFSTTGNWLINKRGATIGTDEWQIIRLTSSNSILLTLFNFNTNGNLAGFFVLNSLNTWNNLVFTYSGNSAFSGLKIYLNGLNQSLTNASTGTYVRMPNGTSIVRAGEPSWSPPPANAKHRGLLDELAIWKNRELTSTEVTELYNAGAGKFYPF
jgi:hypothetical protein